MSKENLQSLNQDDLDNVSGGTGVNLVTEDQFVKGVAYSFVLGGRTGWTTDVEKAKKLDEGWAKEKLTDNGKTNCWAANEALKKPGTIVWE